MLVTCRAKDIYRVGSFFFFFLEEQEEVKSYHTTYMHAFVVERQSLSDITRRQ